MKKTHRRSASGKENRSTQSKVDTVMREFREGTLKTPDGTVVENHDQALASAGTLCQL